MKYSNLILAATIAVFLLIGYESCTMKEEGKVQPPVAKKIKKELTIHDHTRIDNYYWLNQREDPKVISYLEAENQYTKEAMQHTETFQEDLYDEIVGRIKQTDMSVPYKLNGYFYYTRYEEGKEYAIYCRKKGSLDSEEEVMIDGNIQAEGYSFFSLRDLSVSEDNKLLAYGVDTVSRRIYTIYVKNLETGELLEDVIRNTSGSVDWANDNKTLFYSTKDETLRTDKIWRHVLGTSQDDDNLVYHEKDSTFSTGVYKSKSREFMIIGSWSTMSSEYRYLDADSPDDEFAMFQTRQKDIEYSIAHYKDKFYISTNYNAKNFRLMETPVGNTAIDNWKEVIPHRDDVLLEDFEVFENYLAVNERVQGITKLRVFNWNQKKDYYIDFQDEAYLAYFSINPEFSTDIVRLGYTSLTTPNSVYDFNMKSKDRELLKQQEVIGDFDPNNYESKRLWAAAADGAQVPISLVYRKGMEKNGQNPLLLYGYGSYGASMDPYFSSVRLSLLDRGFVYAIAHIRGGEELGRQWYDDGKLLNKKNTFTDFIDCGKFLIKKNYTNSDHLYALGGSAGGLLIGAVVNIDPELFNGAIAAVPFVDVITTMLDESIPLTTSEYDEWGNPNELEYYNYILSYSPYDNIESKDYPHLLVTTGLHDSQVQYWEPAKWVAKLREMKTGDQSLLLWTNMDYGHGGASGRFQRYKETALEYAFLLDLEGINE